MSRQGPLVHSPLAGLQVTLNTDDPAMIDDDLGKEYVTLAAAHDYGLTEMVELERALD